MTDHCAPIALGYVLAGVERKLDALLAAGSVLDMRVQALSAAQDETLRSLTARLASARMKLQAALAAPTP